MENIVTEENIKKAAAAIANARGNRRGAPTISNILDILPKKLKDEVIEDAEAALKAISEIREK
jgi:DNA-binding IclR family transcriptional regulator